VNILPFFGNELECKLFMFNFIRSTRNLDKEFQETLYLHCEKLCNFPEIKFLDLTEQDVNAIISCTLWENRKIVIEKATKETF